MKYVHPDKLIRPLTIGLPPDLIDWLKTDAHNEGVPVSRLAAEILQAARKHKQRRLRRQVKDSGPDLFSSALACAFPLLMNLLS